MSGIAVQLFIPAVKFCLCIGVFFTGCCRAAVGFIAYDVGSLSFEEIIGSVIFVCSYRIRGRISVFIKKRAAVCIVVYLITTVYPVCGQVHRVVPQIPLLVVTAVEAAQLYICAVVRASVEKVQHKVCVKL